MLAFTGGSGVAVTHVGQIPFTGSKTRPPQGVFMFQKQLPKLKH